MAIAKASVLLNWDFKGRISYKVTGETFGRNPELWILTPSAPMLFANQLGILLPTNGLTLCSEIIQVTKNIGVTKSINSALKSARIDLLYQQDNSVLLTFWPKQSLLAKTQDIENGVIQLICNYFNYVYSKVDKNNQLSVRSAVGVALLHYLGLLEILISDGTLSRDRGEWPVMRNSRIMLQAIKIISENMHIFDVDSDDYKQPQDINKWYSETLKKVDEKFEDLEKRHKALCKEMGI